MARPIKRLDSNFYYLSLKRNKCCISFPLQDDDADDDGRAGIYYFMENKFN